MVKIQFYIVVFLNYTSLLLYAPLSFNICSLYSVKINIKEIIVMKKSVFLCSFTDKNKF